MIDPHFAFIDTVFQEEMDRIRNLRREHAAFRGYALRHALRDGLSLVDGSYGPHAETMSMVARHRAQSKRWLNVLVMNAPIGAIKVQPRET
jgi:hypothetical protein